MLARTSAWDLGRPPRLDCADRAARCPGRRADAFPWSSWSGSLNLFVWFVVGDLSDLGLPTALRLVGVTVMPLAALLFAVSRVGGGTASGERPSYGNLFLVIHVGFVLAAFAGFTLAAALAGLYLVEERRLQRRSADILRLKLPSLVVLERLTRRTITTSLPVFTVGLAAGFVRLRDQHRGVDALIAIAVATWLSMRPSSPRARPLPRRYRSRSPDSCS